ncbi:MAG: class I tRNA ligase family protein, partial [Candidatus Omnitrophica bacterium]|nr:class I tRNA ligase family protein [Candidatus Omnitrophota bacterium]
NKIWNASRFVLMNIKATSLFEVKPRTMAITVRGLTSNMSLTDRWILSRLNRTVEAVTKALENYRFNEAESIAYDFFWHDFCDWYVEMVKPILADPAPQGCGASSAERTPYHCGTGQAADRREIAELVLMHVLENSLKLLHPFMPFVTEAVWQNIKEQQSIMTEKWPEQDKSLVDKGVEKNIELIQGIIISIRNIRSDMNIPYTTMLTAYIVPLKKGGGGKLGEGVEYIKRLVRVEKLVIEKTAEKPAQCATAILEGFNIFVPLEGVIDVEAEKSRLKKKMEDIEIKLKSADKRLKDKAFIAKAPEKVVNMEKEKSASLKEQIERLKKTLKSL